MKTFEIKRQLTTAVEVAELIERAICEELLVTDVTVEEEVNKIVDNFNMGFLTDNEKHTQIICAYHEFFGGFSFINVSADETVNNDEYLKVY